MRLSQPPLHRSLEIEGEKHADIAAWLQLAKIGSSGLLFRQETINAHRCDLFARCVDLIIRTERGCVDGDG